MLNTDANHVDDGGSPIIPGQFGDNGWTWLQWLSSVDQHCVAEDGHAVARLRNKGGPLFYEGIQAEGGPRQSNGRT